MSASSSIRDIFERHLIDAAKFALHMVHARNDKSYWHSFAGRDLFTQDHVLQMGLILVTASCHCRDGKEPHTTLQSSLDLK